MAIKKYVTLVEKLNVPKGTHVSVDTTKDAVGKTGQILCNVGNGALFYTKEELEEVA